MLYKLDGGADVDSVAVNSIHTDDFTVLDAVGGTIFEQGTGGTWISIKDPENLVILVDEGALIYPPLP